MPARARAHESMCMSICVRESMTVCVCMYACTLHSRAGGPNTRSKHSGQQNKETGKEQKPLDRYLEQRNHE